MPGLGGSQRLTRLAGQIERDGDVPDRPHHDAAEAERAGSASGVVPAAQLLPEALVAAAAAAIAGMSQPIAAMVKESVNRAGEVTAAFVAKRAPEFRNG